MDHIKQAMSWVRDLTREGVEPNPGYRRWKEEEEDALRLARARLRRLIKDKEKRKQDIRRQEECEKNGWVRDLTREGVEPNPGPSNKTELTVRRRGGKEFKIHPAKGKGNAGVQGIKKDRRMPVKKHKNSCSRDKAKESVIIDQLVGEIEKVAGERDAAEEMEEPTEEELNAIAERISLRIALEEELDEKLVDRITDFMPSCVEWHSGIPSSDIDTLLCKVQARDLEPLPVPHVKFSAMLLGRARVVSEDPVNTSDKIKSKVSADRILTPLELEVGYPQGRYHVVEYVVERVTYGLAGVSHEKTSMNVRISPQEFAYLRACRVHVGGNFMKTLAIVQAKRQRNRSYLIHSFDRHNNSVMQDQLMAALLLVEDDCNFGLVNLCHNLIQRDVSHKMNVPMVEGTYVRGYQTSFAEIFKGAFKDVRELLKRGESAEEIAEKIKTELVSPLGDIKHAEREFKQTQVSDYCRVNHSFHVEGIIPTFPDPGDFKNRVVGCVKRLLRPPPKFSDEFRAALHEASAAIRAYVMRDGAVEDVSHDQIVANAVAKAGEMDWSEEQKADFVSGAQDILGAAEAGDGAIREVLDKVPFFGNFIKAETYPADAIKAVRYITAPSHRVRGILFGLLSPVLDRISHSTCNHNVKGLNIKEMDEKVMLSFTGVRGGILNSDYSSFESLICDEILKHEGEDFAHLSQSSLRPAVQILMSLFYQYKTTASNSWMSLVMPPIRASGTYQTSIGNWVANCRFLLATFKVIDKEFDCLSYLHRGHFILEGDDGIIKMIPGVTVEKFVQTLKDEAGIELTSASHVDSIDGEFCSAVLSSVIENGKEVVRRMAHPIEVLSKVTASISADKNTKNHDEGLSFAKIMSFQSIYGKMPVVGDLFESVLEDGRSRMGKMSRNPLVRDFLNKLSFWPERLASVKAQMKSRVVEPLTDELRHAYAKAYGIAVDEQHRIEKFLAEEWQRVKASAGASGVRKLVCPIISRPWQELKGVKRMVVEEFNGLRNIGSEMGNKMVAVSAALDRSPIKAFLPTGALSLISLLMNICGGALLGATGWLAASMGIAAFGVAAIWCLGVLCLVFLVGVLVCYCLLGMPWNVTRKVIAVVSWSMILLSLYYWWSLLRRRAAARRAAEVELARQAALAAEKEKSNVASTSEGGSGSTRLSWVLRNMFPGV